jgi:glycosyltransferase involved in cell wall biosynthesis
MKRVLVLAYLFPPIANSGTQRPLKFIKYLADHGWEPIVVTADRANGLNVDPTLLQEIPSGVRVVRVPMLNEWIGDVIAAMLGGGALARRIGNGVRWRLQNRRRSPDFYAWWQPTAERAALKISREIGFDAIYATGYPWTSLMIGHAVARATGRPFVADFRDLWSGENQFRDERPPLEDERRFERTVVMAADAVVSASDAMTRLTMNAYPSEDQTKFVTIHNGFDRADFDVAPAPRGDGKFRIVYTGVWKDAYNPADLYKSIDWIRRSKPELLENVEVVAAGFGPSEARRWGLAKYITELGVVSHPEAVQLMRSADLLYLAHSDLERQWSVPGKLYEYLASGAPVLALTDPRGETAKIIRAVGGGVVASPEDPGNLYHRVMDACRGTLNVPPRDPRALEAFERQHLTGKLADVLNAVSNRVPVAAVTRPAAHAAAAFPRLRPR